ncbi:MAG: hypothetical protein NZ521_10245, partial [Flammeovirgaceae bacterium]|nr:hypothetical protein [Flammeovirgaceae bacterium]
LITVFLYSFYHLPSFRSRWEYFWQRKVSIRTIDWLITTYYVGMLYYMHDWWFDFEYFPRYESFYRPISFLSLLHLPFPPTWMNWMMYIMLIVSIVACIFRLYIFFFSISAAILFHIAHAYYFSFEKIDHGFATFGYVAMLMPFLANDYQKARLSKQGECRGWSLWLMQSAIAFSYFLSGLEKIWTGRFIWFSEHHLSAYLAAANTDMAKMLLQYPPLVQSISIFIISFQLTFPMVLFYRRATWFYLLRGAFFHLQTKFIMNIGAWLSPWIWAYVCFIFPLLFEKKYATRSF